MKKKKYLQNSLAQHVNLTADEKKQTMEWD